MSPAELRATRERLGLTQAELAERLRQFLDRHPQHWTLISNSVRLIKTFD